MMAARHSGLQLRVLSLYRACMRQARGQVDPDRRAQATDFVRASFRGAGVKRSSFSQIEFLVKRGERQLKMASKGDGFSVSRVGAATERPSPSGAGL